jgi:phosphoribosylaminoimidazole-succinocarboxamide synthase
MKVLTETNLPGLSHKGKVRDTYELGEGQLLMVATDRISAFDVILPTGIPSKGVILNKISAFWFRQTEDLIPNHLIATYDDPQFSQILKNFKHVEDFPDEVLLRSMIVSKAERFDVECIARGYLTGSGWEEYRMFGTVGGAPQPPGLVNGSKLPEVLFTPTTKAEEGHDQPLSMSDMHDTFGMELTQTLKEATIQLYEVADGFASQKGLIIADTKMEFGLIDGRVTVIDELLTPDSSRFWASSRDSRNGAPMSFDKQFVRDWLSDAGWNREPPAPELPDDIVSSTRDRYMQALKTLTGQTIE